MTEPFLVPLPEAAEILGVHVTTVRRKIRAGELRSEEVDGTRLVDVSGAVDQLPEQGVIRLVGIRQCKDKRNLWEPVFVELPASEATSFGQPRYASESMTRAEQAMRDAYMDQRGIRRRR